MTPWSAPSNCSMRKSSALLFWYKSRFEYIRRRVPTSAANFYKNLIFLLKNVTFAYIILPIGNFRNEVCRKRHFVYRRSKTLRCCSLQRNCKWIDSLETPGSAGGRRCNIRIFRMNLSGKRTEKILRKYSVSSWDWRKKDFFLVQSLFIRSIEYS